jgi:hypothetical protein
MQFAVDKSNADEMGRSAYPDTPLESVRRRRFNPSTALRTNQYGRSVMAKGQMRSNKEKKKPKAEWNKKKKGGGPNLSPFALTREPIQPGQNPFAKKST